MNTIIILYSGKDNMRKWIRDVIVTILGVQKRELKRKIISNRCPLLSSCRRIVNEKKPIKIKIIIKEILNGDEVACKKKGY